MNPKQLTNLGAASVLGLLCALPLAGQAYDDSRDDAGRRHGQGHGHHGGPHGADMARFGPPQVMRLVRRLDMSDTQREQVFAIVDRYQPGMRRLMFSLGDGRANLKDVLTEGGYDPTRLEQDALAQGQAAQALYVSTARMLSEISALLTPEQRAMLERRREVASTDSPR